VNLTQFAIVAAPIAGSGRSQLQIYEQLSSQRPCFSQNGGRVEPLLVSFDFTNICQRYIDSNDYSLRIGGRDLATVYRLSIRRSGSDQLLFAVPTRPGAGPELQVARGSGDGDQFLSLQLEPGWSLRRRSWQGRNLNHLYLYRDQWPQTVVDTIATNAEPPIKKDSTPGALQTVPDRNETSQPPRSNTNDVAYNAPTGNLAAAPLFFCGSDLGSPSTMVRTAAGERSFIRWTSNHFSTGGWSAERRCQVVSERLQASNSRGNLRFLTTGILNDQRVICSASSNGGRCLDLIYTLKKDQDPTQALGALVSARQGIGGPVRETSGRIYLSIDELVGNTGPSTSLKSQPLPRNNDNSEPVKSSAPVPAKATSVPLF
jgi:hypothetical protein